MYVNCQKILYIAHHMPYIPAWLQEHSHVNVLRPNSFHCQKCNDMDFAPFGNVCYISATRTSCFTMGASLWRLEL